MDFQINELFGVDFGPGIRLLDFGDIPDSGGTMTFDLSKDHRPRSKVKGAIIIKQNTMLCNLVILLPKYKLYYRCKSQYVGNELLGGGLCSLSAFLGCNALKTMNWDPFFYYYEYKIRTLQPLV